MSFLPRMEKLPAGLANAREMYGPNFQPSESLKALVYFADRDLSGLAETVKPP